MISVEVSGKPSFRKQIVFVPMQMSVSMPLIMYNCVDIIIIRKRLIFGILVLFCHSKLLCRQHKTNSRPSLQYVSITTGVGSLTYIDYWTEHSGAGRQWSLQPAAATPVYPTFSCSLNLEQSSVYMKSQYVTAARCIPSAECTRQ